jgi:hypothetical protein
MLLPPEKDRNHTFVRYTRTARDNYGMITTHRRMKCQESGEGMIRIKRQFVRPQMIALRGDAVAATAIACFAFVCCFLLLLATSTADGAGMRNQTQAPIEPKADEVLRRMSQTLGRATALRFRAHDMVDQVMDNGQKLQFARTLEVAARRPGAVAVTAKGDTEDVQYAYRDSKLTIVNHGERCYTVQDVPAEIDAMFDFLAERYGITAPLADLLFSDPYSAMTGRVRIGQYLGLHTVGPTRCHHLAFRQDGIDWQIWIEDGAQPVPRKVVITYKELPGQPQFIALLDEWDLAPDLPNETFAVDIPQGYKRIDLQPLSSSPTTAPAKP